MCTGHQPNLCCVGRREYCYGSQQCPQTNPSVCLSLASTMAEPNKATQKQYHVVPFCHNSKSLSPVALLSQEHKDFSAWFTVCEWLWTGPHAVLWCKVCVCLVEVHFYVLSLRVRRDAAVSLYAGVGFLSSTVVMMGCCSEVCGCVLHAATWVGGLLCKRTVSGGALKQRALTVLWTHTNCVYLLFG